MGASVISTGSDLLLVPLVPFAIVRVTTGYARVAWLPSCIDNHSGEGHCLKMLVRKEASLTMTFCCDPGRVHYRARRRA